MEGKSSKFAWGLGILSSLIFVFSFAYLVSPTIGDSLESQGFKLISNQDGKGKLYERSFKRNRSVLISIDLDGFMGDETEDDEGSVALNIWCDLNLMRKQFFVNLGDYKRFCSLSMGDVLWLDKKVEKVVDTYKFSFLEKEYGRFSKDLFPRFKLNWHSPLEKNYQVWKSWCESNLSEPYSLKNGHMKNIIRTNCLE